MIPKKKVEELILKHKNLETELKRDRSVLRYLTVSLCKDALEYNLRRAKGEFKKKKK